MKRMRRGKIIRVLHLDGPPHIFFLLQAPVLSLFRIFEFLLDDVELGPAHQ